MTDQQETSSIDVAVTYFASVLVLFAFVTLAFLPTQPVIPKPSIGQVQPAADAVPASWHAVSERTSYALLAHNRLWVLELTHFKDSFLSPLNWIQTPTHSERASPNTNEPSPRSFILSLITSGADLPEVWVRASVTLEGKTEFQPETCAPFEPSAENPDEPPLFSVLIDLRPETRLDRFLELADVCNIRYRFAVLPLPDNAGSPLEFTIGLSNASYYLETIFR